MILLIFESILQLKVQMCIVFLKPVVWLIFFGRLERSRLLRSNEDATIREILVENRIFLPSRFGTLSMTQTTKMVG